jgi:hypothetical protein
MRCSVNTSSTSSCIFACQNLFGEGLYRITFLTLQDLNIDLGKSKNPKKEILFNALNQAAARRLVFPCDSLDSLMLLV